MMISPRYPGEKPDAQTNHRQPHQRHQDDAAPVHSVPISVPVHDVALPQGFDASMLGTNTGEIATNTREM